MQLCGLFLLLNYIQIDFQIIIHTEFIFTSPAITLKDEI